MASRLLKVGDSVKYKWNPFDRFGSPSDGRTVKVLEVHKCFKSDQDKRPLVKLERDVFLRSQCELEKVAIRFGSQSK